VLSVTSADRHRLFSPAEFAIRRQRWPRCCSGCVLCCRRHRSGLGWRSRPLSRPLLGSGCCRSAGKFGSSVRLGSVSSGGCRAVGESRPMPSIGGDHRTGAGWSWGRGDGRARWSPSLPGGRCSMAAGFRPGQRRTISCSPSWTLLPWAHGGVG
jgi:hypothetical protein